MSKIARPSQKSCKKANCTPSYIIDARPWPLIKLFNLHERAQFSTGWPQAGPIAGGHTAIGIVSTGGVGPVGVSLIGVGSIGVGAIGVWHSNGRVWRHQWFSISVVSFTVSHRSRDCFHLCLCAKYKKIAR